MAATSIWRRATPRRGAIAFTVIRMAEKRSTLGDTAFHSRNRWRGRVAWDDFFALCGFRAGGIATDLAALGALGKCIGAINVAAPVPDIAAHVVWPIAIRGKGADRRSSCESVRGVVAIWELTRPAIQHEAPARPFLIAPRVAVSLVASSCRKFPLRLGGKALPGPGSIGIRILPSDLDHGMILPARGATARAFGV